MQVQGQQQILEHVKFAIPIFHSYGHKANCQVDCFHPVFYILTVLSLLKHKQLQK